MVQNDVTIVRELAKKYRELSENEVNLERKKRAKASNSLIAGRPIVWIDEIPWHEMEIDGELKLRCSDERFHRLEKYLRRSLYRWKYIQADMVLEPCYYIPKAFEISDFGIQIDENILSTDPKNTIVSHEFKDQLKNEDDLARLRETTVTARPDLDSLNAAFANEALDGILEVRLHGKEVRFSPWDKIVHYRGVEPILLDMALRPEFLHKIIARFTEIFTNELNQKEALGLLDYQMPLHCTPQYAADLPPVEKGGRAEFKNVWFRGMAQMFSSVSPAMHEEFDLQYARPLMERCGLVYYGCCEPLDNKIGLLKKIPNMRKIGVSPWSDVNSSAEQIGSGFVFARKPNPAFAANDFDEDTVIRETEETITACLKHGCPYEFVLKDISTVSNKPQNLILWNKTVQKTIDKFYL